nr:polysaccharide biosynthesis tyrosine autokinase [Motilibacter deserti]
MLDYLRVVKRRWYLPVAVLLVCVGASVWATDRQPELYSTTMTFNVVERSGLQLDAGVGADWARGRAPTYVSALQSGQGQAAVSEALELPAGVTLGHTGVSGGWRSETVFIDIQVQADSAQGVYAYAQAVAKAFPTYINSTFEGGGSQVRLRLFEAPYLPAEPFSPDKQRNYLLGLVLGLVLGVAAAFVADSLDRSVRTAEDVERISGLTLLASIPLEHRGQRALAAQLPRSQRAEAVRQLRTNVMFAGVDKPLRTLLVTSAVASEGKTTTAVNLAITSALAGQRVLIVDADLRRPGVSDELGIEGAFGLTNLLIDETTLEDAVQPWGPDGELHVLPSGAVPANPSELLGSMRMLDLIHELRLRYDLVIFDTPPVLPVTDATVLARAVDGVVLVTKVGSTSRDRLKRAVQGLRKLDIRIVGVTCNWTSATEAYYLPRPGSRFRLRSSRFRPRRAGATAEPLQKHARRRRNQAEPDARSA